MYIIESSRATARKRNYFIWLFVGFRLARLITLTLHFCLTVYSTRLNLGQDRKNLLSLLPLYSCQCFSSLSFHSRLFFAFSSTHAACCLPKFNTIQFTSLLQQDYYYNSLFYFFLILRKKILRKMQALESCAEKLRKRWKKFGLLGFEAQWYFFYSSFYVPEYVL